MTDLGSDPSPAMPNGWMIVLALDLIRYLI